MRTTRLPHWISRSMLRVLKKEAVLVFVNFLDAGKFCVYEDFHRRIAFVENSIL